MLGTADRSDHPGPAQRLGASLQAMQIRPRARGIGKTSSVDAALGLVAVVGLVAVLGLGSAPTAFADSHGLPRTAAPEGASVYFISPSDGATVSNPITVRFGLVGMGVAPAGVEKAMTGHHHLLIDTDVPDVSLPVPADDHHKHFGGGQTEVTIELPPGKHTLQLMLGDHLHIPHDPPIVSKRITIQVE